MAAWILPLAALTMSALKSNEDSRNWREQENLEAVRDKWSPWTGIYGQTYRRPSKVDPLLQSAVTAAYLYQLNNDGDHTSGHDIPNATGMTTPTSRYNLGLDYPSNLSDNDYLVNMAHNPWLRG